MQYIHKRTCTQIFIAVFIKVQKWKQYQPTDKQIDKQCVVYLYVVVESLSCVQLFATP